MEVPGAEEAIAPPRAIDRGHLAAGLLTLGGLAASIAMILLSDGFHHDDDICHYLFARSGWDDAGAMWHVWARPGYNIPTMLVARFFGMPGCRLFSALQTALTAYLGYLIARRIAGTDARLSRLAFLAPVLVWGQPLVATLSLTTLTETPAGLYMAGGVWLYLRGNRVWACAVMSLMFVTRYETMALAPIPVVAIIAAALRDADWKIGKALRTPWVWGCAAALLWAPVCYGATAELIGIPEDASPLKMLKRTYTDEYGSGEWTHFLEKWLLAAGPGLLALAAAGAIRLGRRAWLPTAMAVGLVAVHTVVYGRGAFASGGYERFLVPVGALVGALAAVGLAGVLNSPRRFAVAGAFASLALAALAWAPYMREVGEPLALTLGAAAGASLLVPAGSLRAVLGGLAAFVAIVIAAGQASVQIRPLTLNSSAMHAVVTECARRANEGDCADRPALTSHVLFCYLRPNTGVVFNQDDAKVKWRAADPGTLYLWDSKYARPPDEAALGDSLLDLLEQTGRRMWFVDFGSAEAAIFLRLPDPPSTRPRPRAAKPLVVHKAR